MAASPSHRFGQIIGEVLEAAIDPLLVKFAATHGLYLDKRGPRPCRRGNKCSWVDRNNNTHDLDFVLERGGTPDQRGTPVAFIETAWRRYTKHSRNKAQEIQGAILPLVETYRNASPFVGVVLAGVFTQGALTQLKSLNFEVLYFPYDHVVRVFAKFGVDARFDEDTPDSEFQRRVNAYQSMPPRDRQNLAKAMRAARRRDVQAFVASLTRATLRQIDRIIVLPLHGSAHETKTVEDAVQFIEGYAVEKAAMTIQRYEIQIRYNNGDTIDARFEHRQNAIQYLRGFQPDLSVGSTSAAK